MQRLDQTEGMWGTPYRVLFRKHTLGIISGGQSPLAAAGWGLGLHSYIHLPSTPQGAGLLCQATDAVGRAEMEETPPHPHIYSGQL